MTTTLLRTKSLREHLTDFVGDSVARIRDPHGLLSGSFDITEAWLPIGDDGRTYMLCGGTVIACFHTSRVGCLGIGLVLDDKDGEAWDFAARQDHQGTIKAKGPRPSAFLILKPFA